MNYEDPAKEGEHVLQITIDGVLKMGCLFLNEEVMAEPINAQGKEEYKP